MSDATPLHKVLMNPDNPYFGEFVAESQKMQAQRFGDLTTQDLEDAAGRVAVRHAGDLLRAQAVLEGRAPDVTKIPPKYLAQLAKRGVTDADVAEYVRREYPHLTPGKAMAKWVEKASKMPNVDLKWGDDDEPDHVPGKTPARESAD